MDGRGSGALDTMMIIQWKNIVRLCVAFVVRVDIFIDVLIELPK